MNGTYIDICNAIFEVIQKLNTRKRHICIVKERTSPTQQAFENKAAQHTARENTSHRLK
jgi:hypothetical protein